MKRINDKTIVFRGLFLLVSLFLFLSGLLVLTLYEINNKLLYEERNKLMMAIESGPLQLAKLHSRSHAEPFLKNLVETFNENSDHIQGASILSGEGGKDIYASHMLSSNENGLELYQRTFTFANQLYPYHIGIYYKKFSLHNELSGFIFKITLSIAITFCATFFGFMLLVGPISESIQKASKSIEKQDGSRVHFNDVGYEPIYNLAVKANQGKPCIYGRSVVVY
jgi:hypothetical protein